jgi:hypothetical protein
MPFSTLVRRIAAVEESMRLIFQAGITTAGATLLYAVHQAVIVHSYTYSPPFVSSIQYTTAVKQNDRRNH